MNRGKSSLELFRIFKKEHDVLVNISNEMADIVAELAKCITLNDKIIITPVQSNGVYTVHAQCQNCGREGIVTIPAPAKQEKAQHSESPKQNSEVGDRAAAGSPPPEPAEKQPPQSLCIFCNGRGRRWISDCFEEVCRYCKGTGHTKAEAKRGATPPPPEQWQIGDEVEIELLAAVAEHDVKQIATIGRLLYSNDHQAFIITDDGEMSGGGLSHARWLSRPPLPKGTVVRVVPPNYEPWASSIVKGPDGYGRYLVATGAWLSLSILQIVWLPPAPPKETP